MTPLGPSKYGKNDRIRPAMTQPIDTLTDGDPIPPGCDIHTLGGVRRLFMWLVPALSEEKAAALAEEAMREMLPTSEQAIRDFIARHAPEGR